VAGRITDEDAAARQAKILDAARWCFLNFGFSKTSLDDIARRAGISRTLLYKTFKDKEDIFTAVFEHWLIARLPEARAAAGRTGDVYERLLVISQVVVIEPWKDMVGAPMSGEYFDVCARINPKITEHHRAVALECVALVLRDNAAAEVFLLALDGMLSDDPTPAQLEERVRILAAAFARRHGRSSTIPSTKR
jgi:AcrR family transcriptional regulator